MASRNLGGSVSSFSYSAHTHTLLSRRLEASANFSGSLSVSLLLPHWPPWTCCSTLFRWHTQLFLAWKLFLRVSWANCFHSPGGCLHHLVACVLKMFIYFDHIFNFITLIIGGRACHVDQIEANLKDKCLCLPYSYCRTTCRRWQVPLPMEPLYKPTTNFLNCFWH